LEEAIFIQTIVQELEKNIAHDGHKIYHKT